MSAAASSRAVTPLRCIVRVVGVWLSSHRFCSSLEDIFSRCFLGTHIAGRSGGLFVARQVHNARQVACDLSQVRKA